MFFPELIKNIKSSDIVLEVGPGGTPHPRSDYFLEFDFNDDILQKMQRGNADKLITEKPVVYYDGKKFPFPDKKFDYVICSHVLEHVEDVELFASELMRVAYKGYVEYPTVYYEYIYNFTVHKNFLKHKGEELLYLKKTESCLEQFSPVHRLLYDSLGKGYTSLVDSLKNLMFEGFEWQDIFYLRKAQSIDELTWKDYDLPKFTEPCNTKDKKTISEKLVDKMMKLRLWR